MFWTGDLEHFAAFCRTLTLKNGRPFELEPFQRTILADYFRGATETLVLIPKKNGKTTLMAALLVYHLVYVDEAEAYLVASSVKQAAICYDIAKGFVDRSPALQRRVVAKPGTKELRSRRDNGTAKVLAADADTADGVGPTFAIVDELHRAKSTAIYDVLRDGLVPGGAMLAISTAGDDEEGALGVMRSNYLAFPGKRIRGRYTYCRSPDKTNVMHEWALRPTDDLENLDIVKSVNPLRAMTKARLRRRRDSPSMTMPSWARFACNIWAQGDDAAIATLDWARKARPGLRIPAGDGSDVVTGIDLGWTRDYTALVPVGHGPENRDEALIDERLVLIPAGTQPGRGPTPKAAQDLPDELRRLAGIHPGKVVEGRMTDEEVIKGALVRLWLIWPRMRWAADPNAGAQSILQWIERELADGDEDRIAVHSQQPAAMQVTSMHLSTGIRTRSVQEPPEDIDDGDDPLRVLRSVPVYHPDDARLNAMIRAATARYSGERWRFDKRSRPRAGASTVAPRPIDGVVGAALGYHALMAPVPEPLQPFVL